MALYGQLFKATEFDLINANRGYEGLASNAASDILHVTDSLIFIATANGLSVSQDGGNSFHSYYAAAVGIGKGGVSAMTALGNHIWIATVFDSAGVEEVTGTGSGISHSADGGETWKHYSQMLDHPDSNIVRVFGQEIDALPVTVPIDNITFDLVAHVNSSGDTLLWAASFAGGTRVSKDFGQSWKRVILPPDGQQYLNENSNLDFDYSPVDRSELGLKGNFNHESFSLLAYVDTIVVGTAAGINISEDCGKTWENFSAQNSAISGNFVVALHRAEDRTIYGGVLPANGTGEYQSLVYSRYDSSGSRQWKNDLVGTRIYNINSFENKIYVASKSGAWLSQDAWNWILLNHPQEEETGDILFSDEIYAIAPDFSGRIWLATSDGMAMSADDGISWNLYRKNLLFANESTAQISAYPNPFSPTRMNVYQNDGYVRLHCQFPASGTADIDIYDFSMMKVCGITNTFPVNKGIKEFVWNGKNSLGDLVANAVYFVRLIHRGDDGKQSIGWTKLIILE